MNREIKFRGKRVDNGEWVYGDYCKLPNFNIVFLNEKNELDAVQVIPETVGQYIGRYDNNLKEIYEKAPIKASTEWNLGVAEIIGIVVYDTDNFKAGFSIEGEIGGQTRKFPFGECWDFELLDDGGLE